MLVLHWPVTMLSFPQVNNWGCSAYKNQLPDSVRILQFIEKLSIWRNSCADNMKHTPKRINELPSHELIETHQSEINSRKFQPASAVLGKNVSIRLTTVSLDFETVLS